MGGIGKQYSVALATSRSRPPAAKGLSKHRPAPTGKGLLGSRKGADNNKTLEEQARTEAIRQLRKASNTEGRVWIHNWNRKFKDELGNLRDFLEDDEHFIVTPGEGSKYTVELADPLSGS